MKIVKNNSKLLTEQLSKINRLIGKQINEERKFILTESQYIFRLEEFLSNLTTKIIPKENKAAWSILDGLSMKSVKGVEFDDIGGVIKNIYVKNLNDVQIKSLMRIPQVRKALEEYFENFKFRPNDPSEPVYKWKINDKLYQSAVPDSPMGKLIRGYLDTQDEILKVGKAATETSYYTKKYFSFEKIVDYFKKTKAKSLWLNRYKTFDTPNALTELNKLIDETIKIANEYEARMLNGRYVTNHELYQKKLTEKMRHIETYHERMQRDFYKQLVLGLPESVKRELNDKIHPDNVSLDELATIWKELTEVNKLANDVERKYVYLFKGYGKMFGAGYKNFFKRFGTWLLTADARLAADFRNNIKAKGRWGVIWREAFYRSAVLALAYGIMDWAEAYYENQSGVPFKLGPASFKPDKEWGMPKDFKGEWTEAGMYAIKHVMEVGGLEFYKNPISTFAEGPVPKILKVFFGDPNNQAKKSPFEQQLYRQQWSEFWKKYTQNNPEYINSDTLRKQEIERNITDSFQTAYMSAIEARKALDSLDK